MATFWPPGPLADKIIGDSRVGRGESVLAIPDYIERLVPFLIAGNISVQTQHDQEPALVE